MAVVAVLLVILGVAVASTATADRRRRWRQARPFAGGEHAAPEPTLVPNRVVYQVYAGWLLVAAGVLIAVLVLS